MSVSRLLIVDDSKVSRLMSAGLIRQLLPEAQIVEAENGARAMEITEGSPPDFAIVDMNMAGMTGLELAEQLRARTPGLPIALLTANVQAAVMQKAQAQGVKFFRKPISENLIREILTTLGAGK